MAAARGRPPKGDISGKASVFTTRIRPELRAKLDAAAKAEGHSLSQHVERRLSDSFIEEQRIEDLFGSAENYWLMRVVSIAMQDAKMPFVKSGGWRDDPAHFEVVLRTVVGVLETLRPNTTVQLSPIEKEMSDYIGERMPIAVWQTIKDADAALPFDRGSVDDQLASKLKRKLGGIVDDALERAKTTAKTDEHWKKRRDAAYIEQHEKLRRKTKGEGK